MHHIELLNTQEDLGTTGMQLYWFQSYILDRKQFVQLSQVENSNQLTKIKSSLQTVTHGLPQGAVIWPVLFLFT